MILPLANNSFAPERVLLNLSGDKKNPWTVDDAMKGVSIIGGTGSGKTSASGKKLAMRFLQEGWGGLVLCAKSDEADLWKSYCVEAGREKDYLRFENGSTYNGKKAVFNPIDYESRREGEGANQTQNISNIFMNLYKMGNRISGGTDSKDERYWDTALKRCLNRTIELLKLAKEDLTYSNMVKILNSIESASGTIDNENRVRKLTSYLKEYETTEEESQELLKRDNYCMHCLFNAYKNNCYLTQCPEEIYDTLQLVEYYFAVDMLKMHEKTKSVVTESFLGLLEPFLYGLLYSHFTGVSTITPDLAFTEGKVIVLNFPIKEYLDVGLIAQCLFKQSFQQAVERRKVTEHPNPVFLWADEAHYFLNPYDQIFLTTARSSRTATVYLSQSISNYYAAMGEKSDSKARVDSLMGNLSTKIFHANSDAETNEYASRLIGEDVAYSTSAEFSEDAYFGIREGKSKSISSEIRPQVKPKEFTTLKSGGVNHNFKVESVIMVSGRTWIVEGKEQNFIMTTFNQDFKK